MAATPSAFATRGELLATVLPSIRSSPPSGSTAPVMILISVDLPAPFSPMSACTSPARSSSEALFSAWTPAYDFVMSVARRSGTSAIAFTPDDDDVEFGRAVDADGQRQLDVGSARRAGDEGYRAAQAPFAPVADRAQHLAQSLPHVSRLDDCHVRRGDERGEAVALGVRLEDERAGLGHAPLRARHAEVAVEEVFGRRTLEHRRRQRREFHHTTRQRRVRHGDALRVPPRRYLPHDSGRLRLVLHAEAAARHRFERLT